MFVKFEGNYVSKRDVQGKQSVYNFFKFVDDREAEIELQVRAGFEVPVLQRFKRYYVTADIQQGRYPRAFLVDFKPADEKK